MIHRRLTRGLLIEGICYGILALIERTADITAKGKGHLRLCGIVESVADKGGHRRLDVGVPDRMAILILNIIVSRRDRHHDRTRGHAFQAQFGEVSVRSHQLCIVLLHKCLQGAIVPGLLRQIPQVVIVIGFRQIVAAGLTLYIRPAFRGLFQAQHAQILRIAARGHQHDAIFYQRLFKADMRMGALDHIQIPLRCSCNGFIFRGTAVAQRNDQVAAFFLLQKLCIDIGHFAAIHPFQVGVFAVAIGLLAQNAKQTYFIAAHHLDGVILCLGLRIRTRCKGIGAQVFRLDVGICIRDLLPGWIVLDKYIGHQQLRQSMGHPIIPLAFPRIDPGVYHRLVAHIKFVVAQGAKIHFHLCQRQDLPAFLVSVLIRCSLGVVSAVQGERSAQGFAAHQRLRCRHSGCTTHDLCGAIRIHGFGGGQVGVDVVAQQQHHISLVLFVILDPWPGPSSQQGGHSRSSCSGAGGSKKIFARDLLHLFSPFPVSCKAGHASRTQRQVFFFPI